MMHVTENTIKNDKTNTADSLRIKSVYPHKTFKDSISHKAHSTRHFSISFPEGSNPLEHLSRTMQDILATTAETVGILPYQLTAEGYTVTLGGRKPHCHLLVHSKRSKKTNRCWNNVSKEAIENLQKKIKQNLNLDLKVTPTFDALGWFDYVHGEKNLLACNAVVVKIPVIRGRKL